MKDLPYEILRQIFSSLKCHQLFRISLVSHQFHEIIQPILYKKPFLWPTKDWDPLPLFLRTLLHAPCRVRLASYVWSLGLDTFDPEPVRNAEIAPLPVPALNHGFDSDTFTERGPQVILLLGLLPRLTCLNLPDLFQDTGTVYEHLKNALEQRTNLPVALRNIVKFKSSQAVQFSGVTPSVLVALMDLPAIRRIIISLTDEQVTAEAVAHFVTATAPVAGTSPVTKLTMNDGRMAVKSLAAVLKIPKALSRFTYDTMMAEFDLLGIGRTLLPLQHSLQHLDIQFYNREARCADQALRDTIGNLRGWTSLRTLDIQIMTLLGRKRDHVLYLADVLPPNLLELRIQFDRYWPAGDVVQQVIGVLERGELASLRGLWVWPCDDSRTRELEERLLEACKNANVRRWVAAKFT